MMHDLKTISQSRDLEELSKYFPIPHETAQKWMESNDLESLCLAYDLITDENFAKGIEPPLHFEEVYSFSLQFLERCIKECPDPIEGELDAYTRYQAGNEIFRWFYLLWDNEVHHNKLEGFKRWLEKIVIEGDDEIRNCIFCTVIEHLDKRAYKFFKDWRKDPILKTALE